MFVSPKEDILSLYILCIYLRLWFVFMVNIRKFTKHNLFWKHISLAVCSGGLPAVEVIVSFKAKGDGSGGSSLFSTEELSLHGWSTPTPPNIPVVSHWICFMENIFGKPVVLWLINQPPLTYPPLRNMALLGSY